MFAKILLLAVFALVMFVCLTVCGCSSQSRPVFQASGDLEDGTDVVCPLPNSVGWHKCARTPFVACCPEKWSCGDDDFVARKGVCRYWGGVR